MKKLFLFGLLVAVADPIVLYFIYRAWGGWALLAVLLLSPVVGGWLASIAATRMVDAEEDIANDVSRQFGHRVLLVAARFLFWYPGPLSTLLALLLLIPGVRRLLQNWAVSRLQKAVRSGNLSVFPNMGGVVYTSTPGSAGASPMGPVEPLKRAHGKVIDAALELPPPDGDEKEEDE